MKPIFTGSLRMFFALIVAAAFASHAAAQNVGRDLRVVSARAGGVNYVFGEVKSRSAGKDVWRNLSETQDLADGDAVRTGATGLAEILLNPGSYLRLGVNSEAVLMDASLEDLRLKVERGSVVIEAVSYSDKSEPFITAETPRARVSIVKSGVYRINVTPEGETEVAVVKGRAHLGDAASPTVVKSGKVARVGASAEIAKLDKKMRDELDEWSKKRGKELAEANRKISEKQADTLIASLNSDPLFFSSQSGLGGVWFFNSRTGCYTYLPYNYNWRSPYGHWYDSSLGWISGPCYNCGGSGRGGYASGGNSGGVGNAGGGNSGGQASPAPIVNPAPAQTPRPALEQPVMRDLPARGRTPDPLMPHDQ